MRCRRRVVALLKASATTAPAVAAQMPQLWLAVAAMSVTHTDAPERMKDGAAGAVASTASMETVPGLSQMCENHQDGKTLAKWARRRLDACAMAILRVARTFAV
mgnify:CR=1 FL=1